MEIDLCKIFGVEEGEEFKIDYGYFTPDQSYKIKDNQLYEKEDDDSDYIPDDYYINDLRNIKNIIKLPKKKEFTDDELFLFKKVNKEYEWCARDKNGTLYLYEKKPYKKGDIWYHNISESFNCYNHLFNSILWEDEEPVYIPDYVER